MSLLRLRSREYRLRVGTVTVGLRIAPRRYQGFIAQYWGRPSARTLPDFRVSIRVVGGPSEQAVPDSLFHGKHSSGRSFSLAGGLVRGRRLPGDRGVELRVPAMLLHDQVVRVFEQLLYQAFYAGARARSDDSCLVHAAGVIRQGGGYLFVGPSGAGKTTVARLSVDHRVLNDEVCQLQLSGQSEGVVLHDTPFNGFFRDKVEGNAPLRAVFLLSPSDGHRVLPLGRSEAAAAIFQQVVPPVALDEPVGPRTHRRMLEIADRLGQAVPVHRLEFRQDGGFWTQIDRAMEKGGLT